ncbi:MAG: rRNA adenine N-6-methyltransferase family protein [Balneolales bacterium]
MKNYIKTFIKDKNVASIAPTSERVVRSVCEPIDFTKDLIIVEYGPGNGVFTRYLLKKMTAGSRIIVIETNHDFVAHLRKNKDSRLSVFQDSAENVGDIMKRLGHDKADYIVSGIPFSFLNAYTKDKILLESKKLLTKNQGMFLAYQTSTHLKKPLQKHFDEVWTNFKYLNIPPMCVYKAYGFKKGYH